MDTYRYYRRWTWIWLAVMFVSLFLPGAVGWFVWAVSGIAAVYFLVQSYRVYNREFPTDKDN